MSGRLRTRDAREALVFGTVSAVAFVWGVYDARTDGYSWAVSIVAPSLILAGSFVIGTVAGKVWRWVKRGTP